MQFEYNGKQYDIRLKARYLPKELHNVGTDDLIMLMSSRTDHSVKQTILNSYIEGATVL